MLSRRQLLSALAAAPLAGAALPGTYSRAAAGAAHSKFRLGVTDWNLKLTCKPEAVGMASQLGFEGVQISFGRTPVDGRLPLADPALQQAYLDAARKHSIALDGTCLDILHTNGLKNDKLAQKWVADSIPVTAKLGAKVVLLPFFGKRALETHAEMDYVGDCLRELGQEAEKAGVVLGLEDTISAEDNVRIADRSRSRAVLTYYDVGNSMQAGFDPVAELKWLGANRICQIHLKDNPHYLGEGKINFTAVVNAIVAIGFNGYANLETDAPSNAIAADMKRNHDFIVKLRDAAQKA